MKRVLIVALPEKGHYHPFFGPAAALVQRGATVAWASPRDIRAPLAAAGFDRVFFPTGAPPPAAENRGAALADLLRDKTRLRAWIRALLVDSVEAEIEPLRRVLRDFRPDVVVLDAMAYQAALAAEHEGLPWICWSTSLNPVVPPQLTSDLIDDIAALAEARDALFRRHGVTARFRVSDVLSPRGNVVFTTEALVGAPPAGVNLVGPSLPLAPRGDTLAPFSLSDTGRPLVYVSMGSQAYHQPAWFDRLIEAAATLQIDLLIAMGDLAETFSARGLPAQVRCVPYAPQLDVLARASVLITHGGANSVMEALAFGVPLLISPICNDQFHNLHFVARAGAGRRLDLGAAPPAEVAGAIAAAVAPGPLRAAAQRIQASYRAAPGAWGAADLTLRGS